MKHEIIDTVLNVSDTDITFDGIYEKPYIPIEYMAAVCQRTTQTPSFLL